MWGTKQVTRIAKVGLASLIFSGGFLGIVEIASTVDAYTPRASILIGSDAEFTLVNGVTAGSGTPSDPYIIEGWDINASSAIGVEIRNTDAHFILRDSYVHDSGVLNGGIRLFAVTNGTIQNVSLERNFLGISLGASSNVTVEISDVTSSWTNGIFVNYSSNIVIKGNDVWYNEYGIRLDLCSNVTIAGNDVVLNRRDGIFSQYSSDVVIDSNTLSSNGRDGIRLDSSSNVTAISNNVSWNGAIGIDFGYSINGSFKANSVYSNNGFGIMVYNSTYAAIDENDVWGSDYGIGILHSAKGNVLGNNASNCLYGIYLYRSSSFIFHNNTMISDSLFIAGSELKHWNTHVADETNSVNGKPLHFWSNRTNGIIPQGAGEVILANSTNVRVENQNIYNGSVGILLGFSRNNTIAGNTASMNKRYGISLQFSDNNAILGNTVVSNEWWGISLDTSHGNNFANNIVSNHSFGMQVSASKNNILVCNTISDNFGGLRFSGSSDNVMYHNNFINNTDQASDSLGQVNSWDYGYPIGGNYWSNYTGIDQFNGPAQNQSGSDGIGDVPMFIYAGVDRYPLMIPCLCDFAPPDVAILSPAEGEVFTATHVNVTGTASDTGGSGLNHVEVRVNSGSWITANGISSWNSSVDLVLGPNLIEARAWDNGRNPSPIDTVNVTFNPSFNHPPKSLFTVMPMSGTVTTVFAVDASASSDQEDPPASLEVRWDWEDDAIWDSSWKSLKTAQHQYNSLGTYDIRLDVRDTGGLTNQTVHRVWVNNTAPVGSFVVSPVSGNVTTVFSVNASSSSDLEDSTMSLEVRWDWEDDGIWDTSWSTAKSAQHRYPSPGTYTIRLMVRDTAGLTNITVRQVTVENTPPTANFTVVPMSGTLGTVFSVDASACSDLEDPVALLEVRWDWDDDGVWDTNWSTAKIAIHQFDYPGTYTIRLEVRDSASLTDTATKAVSVGSRPSGDTGAAVIRWPIVILITLFMILIIIIVIFMKRRKRDH